MSSTADPSLDAAIDRVAETAPLSSLVGRVTQLPSAAGRAMSDLGDRVTERVMSTPHKVESARDAIELLAEVSDGTRAMQGILATGFVTLGSRLLRAGRFAKFPTVAVLTGTAAVASSVRGGVGEVQVVGSYLAAKLDEAGIKADGDFVRRVTIEVYLNPGASGRPEQPRRPRCQPAPRILAPTLRCDPDRFAVAYRASAPRVDRRGRPARSPGSLGRVASTPPRRRLTGTPSVRFACRLAAVLALVLALAGCRMDVHVGIDVAEDGSGTVSVAVGVDDDLLARVPGAADRVRLTDLSAAGWKVTAPAKEGDGNTWVHLSKPFANPAELKEILGEINGPGGPLGAFDLVITDEWDKTTWRVTGSAGLTGGVDSFVDPDLAAAFGSSKPLSELIERERSPDRAGAQPDSHRSDAESDGAQRDASDPRRTRGPDRRILRGGRPDDTGRGDRGRDLRCAPRRVARVLGDPRRPACRPAQGSLHRDLIDRKHR